MVFLINTGVPVDPQRSPLHMGAFLSLCETPEWSRGSENVTSRGTETEPVGQNTSLDFFHFRSDKDTRGPRRQRGTLR